MQPGKKKERVREFHMFSSISKDFLMIKYSFSYVNQNLDKVTDSKTKFQVCYSVPPTSLSLSHIDRIFKNPGIEFHQFIQVRLTIISKYQTRRVFNFYYLVV